MHVNPLLILAQIELTLKYILFFDDQLDNLKIAKSLGWFTFWIHPDYMRAGDYPFITMAFPNIYECLTYLEKYKNVK